MNEGVKQMEVYKGLEHLSSPDLKKKTLTRKPLVMMVEDNEILLELFRYKFRSLPYRLVTKNNGWDGLFAIQQLKPDVLILDLMLPGLPGKSILKGIRNDKRQKQPKVLVLSSKNSEQDVEDIFAMGADDYVTKPFLLKEILARVERLLKI